MAEIGGTDEALLAAIGEGDRGALRELYDRHAPLRCSNVLHDPIRRSTSNL